MSTALFDIGGTKTRVTISRNGRSFRRPIIYGTPRHYAEGIRQLVDAIRQAADGWKVSRLVGCIAAPLNADHTHTVHGSFLEGWYERPLAADLRRRFHVAVFLENDAAVAGLGEATYGAGRGHGIVGYLTVSTGVGGVRIVDGRIDHATFGFEPGHMVSDVDHRSAVTLEHMISGLSLGRRHKQPAEDINDRRVWRDVERSLAYGLTNLAVLWSPTVIVLGGGVGQSQHLRLNNVRAIFRRTLKVFHSPPRIVRGTLGDSSGLWGALARSRQPLDR